MREKAYAARIKRLKDSIKDTSLQDVLGIPKKEDDIYTNIKLIAIKNNSININIKYICKKDLVFIENIPLDINIYISNYLYSFINLDLTMFIPDDYPFKPIRWVITKINTSYNYKIYKSILKYYSTKIKHYNDNLVNEWFSGIFLEKEILNLVVMLGDVKELIENIYQ